MSNKAKAWKETPEGISDTPNSKRQKMTLKASLSKNAKNDMLSRNQARICLKR